MDEELERLYDEHAQALFGFLLSLTRSEEETRDLLQEIFVKLARDPRRILGARSERPFLLRMAHNLARDAYRRRASRERCRDHVAEEKGSRLFEPVADPDEEEFRTRMSAALDALPHEQRTVVYLKLWEGMTFETIAEALEISPNTAASRYRYGIDKLRTALRPLYDDIR